MKITGISTAEIMGHDYSTYVRAFTGEGLFGNGERIHGGEGCPAMVHALQHYITGEGFRSCLRHHSEFFDPRMALDRLSGSEEITTQPESIVQNRQLY